MEEVPGRRVVSLGCYFWLGTERLACQLGYVMSYEHITCLTGFNLQPTTNCRCSYITVSDVGAVCHGWSVRPLMHLKM